MRLDKFLKVSRIIKRRTVAASACKETHVSVNGRPVKPAYDLKVGDVIEITFGERTFKARVKATPEHAGKGEASELYEILES